MNDGIEDFEIKSIIKLGIQLINMKVDLGKIFSRLGFGDLVNERAMVFHITDLKGTEGFAIDNGKLTAKPVYNPTTIVSCNKATFKAIITGKTDPYVAAREGFVDLDGEHWLRDLDLAVGVLSVFRDVWDSAKGEGIIKKTLGVLKALNEDEIVERLGKVISDEKR